MFSSITIASSTTKPTESVRAISDRLSRLYSEQIHHREGPNERARQRKARDDGGREIPEEQEDHEHDQADGDHQRELHVVHRLANREGAIAADVK